MAKYSRFGGCTLLFFIPATRFLPIYSQKPRKGCRCCKHFLYKALKSTTIHHYTPYTYIHPHAPKFYPFFIYMLINLQPNRDIWRNIAVSAVARCYFSYLQPFNRYAAKYRRLARLHVALFSTCNLPATEQERTETDSAEKSREYKENHLCNIALMVQSKFHTKSYCRDLRQ